MITSELTAKLKQAGNHSSVSDTKHVPEVKPVAVDHDLAAHQTIADLRDELDRVAKARDKFKVRVDELEREKAKQGEEFNIRLKTEGHMQTLNSNRIEDLNKTITTMTRKVNAFEQIHDLEKLKAEWDDEKQKLEAKLAKEKVHVQTEKTRNESLKNENKQYWETIDKRDAEVPCAQRDSRTS